MNKPNLTNNQLKELDSLFEEVSRRQILEILVLAINQMDH